MMFDVWTVLGFVADVIEYRAGRLAALCTRRAWATRTGRRLLDKEAPR